MPDRPLKISESAAVQMPMKTVASLLALCSIGTYAFFGIQEKLNQHATQLEIMDKDVVMNSDFRIKWPRGLLGSLPADASQYMLIEDLYKQVEKIQTTVDGMMHNKVNIEFLQTQVEKMAENIERLKDGQRSLKYTNGR